MTHQASLNAARTCAGPSGSPSTATSTLTPRTKPICRAIVTTAEPVAVRSGGKPAVAADMMVGSAKPTPIPPRSHPGRTSATYDDCGPTLTAMTMVPTPKATHPIAASTPAGTRFETRCDTAAKTGTISGPAAIPNPVLSADQCQTSCSHSTIESNAPANANENSTAVTFDHTNVRTSRSSGSTTGSG